jgi:ABC-type phosphate transport system substrate-binding protein
MIRLLRQQIFPILLLLALLCPAVSAQIAVVVHPDNSILDIELDHLKRIYLGKITTFKSGESIVLTENTRLGEEFYQAVTDMSLRRVRKHWMKIVFEGAYATPPTHFEDLAELKYFISRNRGAIGFVELDEIDSSLKVLTIDGLGPEADNYPLRTKPVKVEAE